ncbi:MAG: HAD-IIIC family phosphatase, partial [Bacteroidia bacterium]|nr:HAD-IIIC family phosphatase [Bacteroidia bacterium]
MELVKDFKELKKNLKKDFSAFKKIKVAVLGDSATQFLVQALRGLGCEEKTDYEIFEADYNQIDRQVLDPSSELYEFDAEFIVIFESASKLWKKFSVKNQEGKNGFAASHIQHVKDLYETISSRSKSKVIYFNFQEMDDRVFGNFSNKTPQSFLYQLRKINFELMDLSSQYKNLFILDYCYLSSHAGHSVSFDTKMYYTSEMVLSIDILPALAKNISDIILSITGKFKKCLILDLDNTTWGGIIGDDGIENIQVGELGIGKVFTELQLWAKQLKERGIILAVCSKNNEETAKEPFKNHPDMVLRLDDISVFVANWDNKADNIKYIQSILNIGFDSMVFLDDNPFERNLVRQFIPEINVPELPEDPALYLDFLKKLNLFETASYTDEDKNRTQQYKQEAERVIT